jgi:hypothetical protein
MNAPHALTTALVRSLLREGRTVRLQVTGRSMMPLLPGGSTVWVRPAGPADLREGDVALVLVGPDRLLLHRVQRRRRDSAGAWTLVTQGDACAAPDGVFAEAAVLGQAVLREVAWRGISLRASLASPLSRLAGRLVTGLRKARRAIRSTRCQVRAARGHSPDRLRRLPGA